MAWQSMAWRAKRHSISLAERLRKRKRASRAILARSCRQEYCAGAIEAKRSSECSARSIRRISKSEKLTEYMALRRRTRLGVSNPYMMLITLMAYMVRELKRD